MGLFTNREKTSDGQTKAPVWFMRQAGRYHTHYQNIRKNSEFMSMCKTPELAEEITLGPIRDFDFDAAILFSDLLFPLEQLGMGLNYQSGPPQLAFHLHTPEDLKEIQVQKPAGEFYQFQKEACKRLKDSLPTGKTLLGFVGAPFTLYTYAVEGAHKGNLIQAKRGLANGLFEGFWEKLFPELLQEMSLQAEGGAEAICLFDTAAGELTRSDYKNVILPALRQLTTSFKTEYPEKKIIYYSKFTHLSYLHEIQDENIDVLGVDWRMSLTQALSELGGDYIIQGNLDPAYLHLPWDHLQAHWREVWREVTDSGVSPDRWICGLGHGVLPKTPEENVRQSVELIHKEFCY